VAFDSVERASVRPLWGGTTMARLKRIAALATPLLRSLDDGQRRNVMTLARTFGLEHLLVSF
jgi:hypothetical protein